jgi:UDP-3-O-acyl-N-acetylglucosamine deacetylase
VAGEITAYKAGHALHSKFVEQILRAAEAEEGAPAMAARGVESFA